MGARTLVFLLVPALLSGCGAEATQNPPATTPLSTSVVFTAPAAPTTTPVPPPSPTPPPLSTPPAPPATPTPAASLATPAPVSPIIGHWQITYIYQWDNGFCHILLNGASQTNITNNIDTGFDVVSSSPLVVRVTGLTENFVQAAINGNTATWTVPGIPGYGGATGVPNGATGGFTYVATFTGGVVSGTMSGDYQSGFVCENNGGGAQPSWSGTLCGFRLS